MVVLSPSHEKLTNTHPSRSGDIGVGVGDVGAPSVDVGVGVGVETGGRVEEFDAVVVAVFCPKT